MWRWMWRRRWRWFLSYQDQESGPEGSSLRLGSAVPVPKSSAVVSSAHSAAGKCEYGCSEDR